MNFLKSAPRLDEYKWKWWKQLKAGSFQEAEILAKTENTRQQEVALFYIFLPWVDVYHSFIIYLSPMGWHLAFIYLPWVDIYRYKVGKRKCVC